MKDGLLEDIKARGHWKVILRPLDAPGDHNIVDLQRDVTKCSVSLRGWDFPHIATRNDQSSGTEYGSFVEQWTDWYRHREFWRMYQSGQFVWMKVLQEEFYTAEETYRKPDDPFISVLGAVYSITEFFEFAKRMVEDGPYPNGTKLAISLDNTAGRVLWISEGNRMPFLDDYKTTSSTITLEREIRRETILETAVHAANSAIIEFFSHFGWKAPSSRIEEDQLRLYEMRS